MWFFGNKSGGKDSPLSERKKKQISKRILVLAEEKNSLEKRRENLVDKSPYEKLFKKMRELERELEGNSYQVNYKQEEARNASSRKEKRMFTTEAKEWQKIVNKISRELDQVTRKCKHHEKKLDRALEPINVNIRKLSSEISKLEKQLVNDYKTLKSDPFKTSNKAPQSDIEREVFSLRNQINQLLQKMNRYSHINKEIKRLNRELDFRTRHIEGEKENANVRRINNAYKWHKKKVIPLQEKEDREKQLRGLSSNPHNDIMKLQNRLSELQPQYDAYLQEQEQTRRNKANQRKQAQLTQEALKKINSLLKDDNF